MRLSFFLAFAAATLHAADFHLGLHTLTAPDGFVVEVAAGPPLVQRPIDMAFDEQGALYVTDSSGSNENPADQWQHPTHRVLRLTDRTGSGRFDTATVFADELTFPEGAMWLDGSLYVAAPPVIWKFTDTDGDGVADRREVWFDGRTVTHCANDLHGPYAGPDGYIYWCKGAFAEQTHRLADGRELVTRASHLFRARPDGSGLEMVMTAGMDNPVDVVFSPTGERFLCGTFLVKPGGGLRDGIVHAVYGGVWGKEHGVLEGHPRTGELMPIMTQLGPAAACGLEMLHRDALGLRGVLLCAQFNTRRVTQHRLVEDGATYHTVDADFLVSDQTDFHPTDVVEAADGSVLIADTGGWYKLCCPTSKSLKPEVLGAIYRVRRTEPLAAEPAGPNRLEGLWKLIREKDRPAVRAALGDADPKVQALAAYGAGLFRDAEARPQLREMLRVSEAPVRRAAAEALGRIGNAADGPALLAMETSDRFLFHAAAYALYELGADPGGDGELARTVRAMLALPKPARAAALPLIAPAAKPDPVVALQQQSRLEELLPLVQNGDAQRGGELFRSARALCSTCHAISGQGGAFGPDLTKVGAIRTPRDLLEAIVFPSRSYVRSYEPLLVKTRAGAEQLGILKSELQEAIVLGLGPTAEVRIPRAEIAAMSEGPASLMPAGFDGILSPAELADLIAFLRQPR